MCLCLYICMKQPTRFPHIPRGQYFTNATADRCWFSTFVHIYGFDLAAGLHFTIRPHSSPPRRVRATLYIYRPCATFVCMCVFMCTRWVLVRVVYIVRFLRTHEHTKAYESRTQERFHQRSFRMGSCRVDSIRFFFTTCANLIMPGLFWGNFNF